MSDNSAEGPSNGASLARDSSTDQETLSHLADQLVEAVAFALSSETSRPSEPEGPAAESNDDLVFELALRLYALHRIEHHRATQGKGNRDDIAGELERAKLRNRLSDEVLTILDKIQDALIRLGRRDGPGGGEYIPTPAEHMGRTGYERKDHLEEILSRQWQVDEYGQSVTVVDLLLPPFTTLTSHSFVTHTIINLAVDRAWSRPLKSLFPIAGRIRLSTTEEDGDEVDRSARSTSHSLLERLHGLLTPRRQHALHLASLLVLYALTVALAIRPRSLIVPYTRTNPHPAAIEVVFIVWASSFVLESLWRRSTARILLAIPTFLCLKALSTAPAAYSFLCLSIPPLTVLLVLPSAPSFTYVSPRQALPLATILYSALGRATASLTLMGPLVVVIFFLFALAMNGETRLFTMDGLTAALQHLWVTSEIMPETAARVAPYEARLAMFIALMVLLLLAIPLAISQSYPPLHPELSNRRRGSSPSDEKQSSAHVGTDEWDRDHPPYIVTLTRQHWTSTINYFLRPQPIIPLNIVVLPLDLIASLVMIRPVPLDKAIAIRRKILRWKEVLVVLLMAPLCGVVGALEWLTGLLQMGPRKSSR